MIKNKDIRGVLVTYQRSGRKRKLCKPCFAKWAGIDETSISTACEKPQPDYTMVWIDAIVDSGTCVKCKKTF